MKKRYQKNNLKSYEIVEDFFDTNKNVRDDRQLLDLQCRLENVLSSYDLSCGAYKISSCLLVKYCYANHKECLSSFKNYFTFVKTLNDIRKKRYISGVIVMNEKKELLLIATHLNQWGFPKGKENHSDFEDPKVTAFRELEEETGIVVPSNELKKCKEKIDLTVDYHDHSTEVRLYLHTVPKKK